MNLWNNVTCFLTDVPLLIMAIFQMKLNVDIYKLVPFPIGSLYILLPHSVVYIWVLCYWDNNTNWEPFQRAVFLLANKKNEKSNTKKQHWENKPHLRKCTFHLCSFSPITLISYILSMFQARSEGRWLAGCGLGLLLRLGVVMGVKESRDSSHFDLYLSIHFPFKRYVQSWWKTFLFLFFCFCFLYILFWLVGRANQRPKFKEKKKRWYKQIKIMENLEIPTLFNHYKFLWLNICSCCISITY